MPVSLGGIGMLVEQAVSELSAIDGIEITVVLLGPASFSRAVKAHRDAHYENVEIIGEEDMLGFLHDQPVLPQWAFSFENYYLSYLVAEYLLKLEKQGNGFDLIEFPDYKGFGYVSLKQKRLAGAFSDTQCVVRIHGVTSIWNQIDGVDIHSRERLQLYQMERYSLEFADSWTLPGKRLADQYVGFLGIEYEKLNLITPIFKKLGERGSYWHSATTSERDPIRVMFYGKQQHVKGLDYFIEAAIKLCESSESANRSYEFLVIGQDTPSQWGGKGSYGSELRKRIPEKFTHQIRFLGRIDVRELSCWVNQCACAVIPSRMETFCLAAHELNWLGIPLVLNRIPVFEDYFEDGKSCLFFDNDAHQLAGKIRDAAECEKTRQCLRKGNNAALISEKGESSNRDVYLEQQPSGLTTDQEMREQPLVSIIVPYFNEMRHYLRETLLSVEAQDYPNFEVIVVNDGSTEPVANEVFDQIAGEYGQKPDFEFHTKVNGGLGSARNYGIERSSGVYILPLDSDDIIESRMVSDCVEALERCKDLDAVSTFTSFFQDGSDPRNQIDYVIPYDLDSLLIFLENRAGVACSMFRRSLFDCFKYTETLPAFEDWDFWMLLAKEGKKVEVLPKLLFRYRRRVQSMVSSEGFSRKAQLMHHIADHHREHLQSKGDHLYKAYNQLLSEALEVDENNFPHCKIYLAPNGVYDEKSSLYKRYQPGDLVEFEMRLPFVTEQTVLRFDPAAVPSSIHLNWMSLHHVGDSNALWVATKENDYAPLTVAGTARQIAHPDHLLIAADGGDPQIICPELKPSEQAYLLRVSFRVFDPYEALLFEATGKDYRNYVD